MNLKRESVKELLAAKGLAASYQRVTILDHLMRRMDHPTAGMVYDALSREMQTLSKATVYNALHALVDKGLLTALTITSEETRYDFKRDPHHHFLCKACGSILDVRVRCMYAEAAEVEGHRVEDIHGYFRGTCRGCLKEASQPRKRFLTARGKPSKPGRTKARQIDSKRGG